MLEVIPDELLGRRAAVPGAEVEPVTELLVKLAPVRLRQPVVRSVTQEHVAELEGLAAPHGSGVIRDHSFPNELGEPA